MASYQTFPGQPGSSNSLAKLASLCLPSLANKSFLDIGCNEGYFCGFAFFEGALKSVGIDISNEYIANARRRFPQCTFINGDWENLDALLDGQGKFDVILCSSAIHYAANQAALVQRLVGRLRHDGVFVLEIGIVDPASVPCEPVGDGWYKVKRFIDERLFPSWNGLKAMLAPYAWRYIDASPNQAGDPVPRHVFHISRRKPVALLLMGSPGSGKTTLANKLGGAFPVISGDQILMDVKDKPGNYPDLARFFANGCDIERLDKIFFKIFASGNAQALANAIIARANNGDFIYDGYTPKNYQAIFGQCFMEAGYRVSVIESQSPTMNLYALSTESRREARKYELFLSAVSIAQKMYATVKTNS